METLFILVNKRNGAKTGLDRYENEIIEGLKQQRHISQVGVEKSSLIFIQTLLFYLLRLLGYRKNFKAFSTAPFYIGSYIASRQLSVKIHDLGPIDFPEAYSLKSRILFRVNLFMLSRSSDLILCNSDFTKKSFLKHYNYRGKIAVVHLASSNLRISGDNKFDQNEYLLFYGAMNKRKNLSNLLRAFSIYIKSYDDDLKLLIAGRMDWGGNEVVSLVQDLGLSNRVLLPGYIPEHNLGRIISESAGLVYLSFYEGFGLPLVEAMSLNTPVICSDIDVHREITKGTCLYANPESLESIVNNIKTLRNMNEIEKRSFVDKAKLVALEYSWEQTVSKTSDLLNFR